MTYYIFESPILVDSNNWRILRKDHMIIRARQVARVPILRVVKICVAYPSLVDSVSWYKTRN